MRGSLGTLAAELLLETRDLIRRAWRLLASFPEGMRELLAMIGKLHRASRFLCRQRKGK